MTAKELWGCLTLVEEEESFELDAGYHVAIKPNGDYDDLISVENPKHQNIPGNYVFSADQFIPILTPNEQQREQANRSR